jgi:hypothetical protein
MSRAPLPEVRGSRIAGLIERERALLLLRKQRARHVQLSFGEALIVTREGEGVQTETKGDEEMSKKAETKDGQGGLSEVRKYLDGVGAEIDEDITMIPVCDLRSVDAQPKARTGNDARLSLLERDIASVGKVICPGVCIESDNCYVLADGHRRTFVSAKLGFQYAPMLVVRGVQRGDVSRVARVLWGILNRGVCPMRGCFWFAAWGLIPRKDRGEWLRMCVGDKVRANIRDVVDAVGLERAEGYAREEWIDPSKIRLAKRIHRALVANEIAAPPTAGEIFSWLISKRNLNDMQVWVAKSCDKPSSRKLASAVRADRAFPREKW